MTEHVLRDGEPCGHTGCLAHISHPCEGCGRIGGMRTTEHVHEWNTVDGWQAGILAVCGIKGCDEQLSLQEIDCRLNATQKIIDAPDEVEAGIEIMKFWTKYRPDILEGKDD